MLPDQNEGIDNGPVSDESASPTKPGLRRVMVFSFFVVPFCIAIIGVALFTGVYMLTMDAPDISDLLEDVRHGYSSKRWQSAYQLVALLDTTPPVTLTDDNVKRFIAAFEAADPQEDQAIRQYLALAMGCTRSTSLAPILLEALDTDPAESRPFIIRALGRLGDVSAAPAIGVHVTDTNPTVRLESVVALGALGSRDSLEILQTALNDPEPNIQWDAAIALAKLGNPAGQPTLLALLDREYLTQFPEVDASEANRILRVAIQAGALLNDPSLNQAIGKLASSDSNMAVRRAASESKRERESLPTRNHSIDHEG